MAWAGDWGSPGSGTGGLVSPLGPGWQGQQERGDPCQRSPGRELLSCRVLLQGGDTHPRPAFCHSLGLCHCPWPCPCGLSWQLCLLDLSLHVPAWPLEDGGSTFSCHMKAKECRHSLDHPLPLAAPLRRGWATGPQGQWPPGKQTGMWHPAKCPGALGPQSSRPQAQRVTTMPPPKVPALGTAPQPHWALAETTGPLTPDPGCPLWGQRPSRRC